MHKQRIEYASSLDALIAVTKRLGLYENQYHLNSEDFFDRYSNGQLTDDLEFIEWANDYRHYLALRLEVESALTYVA